MNNLPISSAGRFGSFTSGLVGTILCASMLGLPGAAQAQRVNTLEVSEVGAEQTIAQASSTIIPADSALVVRFCKPVTLNTKNKSSLVNAVLAQPLLDSKGQVSAPINTLVGVQFKPTSEGAQITANNLVIGSRYIPVQTSGVSAPLETRVQEKSPTRENNRPGTVSKVARGVQAILSQQDVVDQSAGDFLGAGLSILSGITRKSNEPKVNKTMEVPEGSTFVLPLSSAITLPPMPSKANSSSRTVCSSNTGTPEEVTDSEEEEDETEATENEPDSEDIDTEEETDAEEVEEDATDSEEEEDETEAKLESKKKLRLV